LAAVFPSILSGCIGVGDVKEYDIKKPNDLVEEIRSWSGKNNNSYKMLSVMDHTDQ
jgi:hypothetical protein